MGGILDAAQRLLEEYRLCDNCLGRQFATLGHGMDNAERGRSLKNTLLLEAHSMIQAEDKAGVRLLRKLAAHGMFEAAAQTLRRLGVEAGKGKKEKCQLCRGKIQEIPQLAAEIAEKAKEFEFNTFLVGAKIPAQLLEAEDSVRARCGAEWGESMKSEFTREIGKTLSKLTGKQADFANPELVVTVSPFKNEFTLKANPLFVEGRYRKLVTGIPQSRWLCRRCGGKGCSFCGGTGKKYPESVQEILEAPILKLTEGEGAEFHAGGREDIDAQVLGSGRPFVVEVKNPRRRFIDLERVRREVNAGGRVEVLDLKLAGKDAVRRVKAAEASPKVYRFLVESTERLTEEDLDAVEKAFTDRVIRQLTPRRVLHRRADKERERRVYSLKAEKLSDSRFEVTLKCQGGLYVKELVDGDEGRTTPSIAEVLGKKVKCLRLSVIDIGGEEDEV
ncbi:tRNA pseudouridine(54/55) synthase Pus10 [Candidatus Hecatella orcuttiae]|uniref:tRNA pseudouridine(54/55) synthase Pus10 n=1 Tax=Candidatus Hecatella orcuttiae TaxID=1935119 RepID=UPI0028681380|nr:tRNA pseudouridine(54/55) synthase Pus10 [Candidatus Hecatella orcuttiae]